MPQAKWIEVPDLRQKLDLLVDTGLVASKRALAEEWAVGRTTLYEWERSSDGKRENRMPAQMFARLQAKFAPLLAHLTSPELREYLTGPCRLLADEITRSKVLDLALTSFLKEATTGEGRVIRAYDDLALVTVAPKVTDPTVPQIRLGELFRLEYALRHRCRYAIVLQHDGRRWGTVSASVYAHGPVMAPGRSPSGDHDYLYESAEAGPHQFYCIQSVSAPPVDLQARLAEPFEIDRGSMAAIAHFFDNLARPDRALQRVDMHVVRS